MLSPEWLEHVSREMEKTTSHQCEEERKEASSLKFERRSVSRTRNPAPLASKEAVAEARNETPRGGLQSSGEPPRARGGWEDLRARAGSLAFTVAQGW
eukprot:6469061-Amphidinium_carterae.2